MMKCFVILVTVCFAIATLASGQSLNEEEWRPERLSKSVLESTLVRYYVFGLKNPDGFEKKDATPEMVEIGPFTYREKRLKGNFKRVNNTTLDYSVHWSMHFLQELTGQGLTEFTEFTAVNVPFITMAVGLKNAGLPKGFNDLLMDEVVEGGESLIRKGLSFGDSTFYGYNVSLYTAILDDITQGNTEAQYPELANGKFAFFKDKNNTITGNYSVESTKKRPFGGILAYNGRPSLGMWPEGTSCDDVTEALDFFTIPRNIKKETILEIFLPENCRKMKMKYVGEDVFRGIPVFVFKFPLEQFSNRLQNEGDFETSCYCLNFANHSSPRCLDEGFLDYSGCSKGAPLIGSFPHFLHANSRHLNDIKGLTPNKSLHESEVMIEPITGTPLYAVRRFQLNLWVHPIQTVTLFENMTERIIPLAWFEHILEVPSSVFADVKDKLEKIKMEDERDIYQNDQSPMEEVPDTYQKDQSPIEEIPDNTLFSERSGFPSDSTGSKEPQAKLNVNAAQSLFRMQSSGLVFIGIFMVVMGSRTS